MKLVASLKARYDRGDRSSRRSRATGPKPRQLVSTLLKMFFRGCPSRSSRTPPIPRCCRSSATREPPARGRRRRFSARDEAEAASLVAAVRAVLTTRRLCRAAPCGVPVPLPGGGQRLQRREQDDAQEPVLGAVAAAAVREKAGPWTRRR